MPLAISSRQLQAKPTQSPELAQYCVTCVPEKKAENVKWKAQKMVVVLLPSCAYAVALSLRMANMSMDVVHVKESGKSNAGAV